MKTCSGAALILSFLAATGHFASGAERDIWQGRLPQEDFQIRTIFLAAGQSLSLELKGEGTSHLDLMVLARSAAGKLQRIAETKGPGDHKAVRLTAAHAGDHFVYVVNSGERASNFELQAVRQ